MGNCAVARGDGDCVNLPSPLLLLWCSVRIGLFFFLKDERNVVNDHRGYLDYPPFKEESVLCCHL